MVQRNGRDDAMLRQRDSCFRRDASTGRRRIDHENQRLVETVCDVDRGTNSAKIVGARARRHDHQVSTLNDMCNRLRDRRRRVDDDQLEADALEVIEASIQLFQRRLRESGRGGRTRVPPFGQRSLRVGVNQSDRPIARALRPRCDQTRSSFPTRPSGKRTPQLERRQS